jgi:hypothetical protein
MILDLDTRRFINLHRIILRQPSHDPGGYWYSTFTLTGYFLLQLYSSRSTRFQYALLMLHAYGVLSLLIHFGTDEAPHFSGSMWQC